MNSSPPTDPGRRLVAGDEQVLAVILDVHGPPVLALLKQRLGGGLTATDLEDVLAAALFRLWQHRARYDARKSSLRVWFYRIAENLARDVLKHGWQKARRLERSLEPAWLAEAADSRVFAHADVGEARSDEVVDLRTEDRGEEHDPLRRRSAPASTELLRELLALLPEMQRRILLADAESREGAVGSAELSRELGIPPGTVRVYRRRALERLRREMEIRGVALPSPARE